MIQTLITWVNYLAMVAALIFIVFTIYKVLIPDEIKAWFKKKIDKILSGKTKQT